MGFCATLPVGSIATANAALEGAGWGPECFSVPSRGEGATTDATHVSLSHLATDAAFQAAVSALPGVVVTSDAYPAHIAGQALEWTDPIFWFQDPVMIGDERQQGGITYRSLIDYNVWPVTYLTYWEPLGVGVPVWVQPTGAHDSYPLNFVVSHLGVNYRSTIPANTTVPGENVIFGWWVVVP